MNKPTPQEAKQQEIAWLKTANAILLSAANYYEMTGQTQLMFRNRIEAGVARLALKRLTNVQL